MKVFYFSQKSYNIFVTPRSLYVLCTKHVYRMSRFDNTCSSCIFEKYVSQLSSISVNLRTCVQPSFIWCLQNPQTKKKPWKRVQHASGEILNEKEVLLRIQQEEVPRKMKKKLKEEKQSLHHQRRQPKLCLNKLTGKYFIQKTTVHLRVKNGKQRR